MVSKGASTFSTSVQRAVLDEQFAKLARFRILVLPLPLLVLGFVIVYEEGTWRRGALAALAFGLVTLSLIDAFNVWRARPSPYAPLVNLAALGLFHPLVVFATGGLESVALPILPAISLGLGLFAPLPLTVVVVGIQELLVATMAFVHTQEWIEGYVPDLLGGGPGSRSGLHVALSASVLMVMVPGAAAVGRKLRSLLQETLARSLAAQDATLQAHREQVRALTSLSAEIAHELKNPLASVKGLAALVGKDLAGKQAERVAVLRREIDRMQNSLEELLNFSRPATPLVLEAVAVDDCLNEVTALHEGMAREHQVKLVVRRSAVVVQCDRRKVRQVLINVVQNALEASPAGGVVELCATSERSVVRIEVADRGEGLDPAMAQRLFESGVTTRATGSGLGLPIARGLMRQHGGDLELLSRVGGGVRAVLTLPRVETTEDHREE